MSQSSRWRASFVLAVLSASAIAFTARAQRPVEPSSNPGGPTAEFFMIRQDQSDCANADVNASDPSRIGGSVWLVRQADGNTSVKVAITGTPNTTYHFYLKCVRQLGDIKTQDEGEGVGLFQFATKDTGPTLAFDMYPEGAPSGNKFQSVQVKFQ
jgi:hypothetical protein